MATVEIQCSRCGADDYTLLDPKTGEVICTYCRNRWIISELAQKTETEKYLEEQAKRPRVVYDNTTETDQQLMQTIAGMAGITNSIGSIVGRVVKTIFVIIAITVFVIIAIIVALTIYRIKWAS